MGARRVSEIVSLIGLLVLVSAPHNPGYAAQSLTPDDIIRLKAAGISDAVILEMIKRGKEQKNEGSAPRAVNFIFDDKNMQLRLRELAKDGICRSAAVRWFAFF